MYLNGNNFLHLLLFPLLLPTLISANKVDASKCRVIDLLIRQILCGAECFRKCPHKTPCFRRRIPGLPLCIRKLIKLNKQNWFYRRLLSRFSVLIRNYYNTS